MNRTYLVLFFVTCIIGLCFSQSRFDDVTIKVHKLTDRISMLEGSGGNIGLYVGDSETFIIDDQYAPLSDKIKKAISTLTDQPVTRLFNTHWHGDHTGGNQVFGSEGAQIMAHDNVYKRMSTEQSRGGSITPASSKEALPQITFNDKMQFYALEEPALFIHVHNAHTDGDALVWCAESNVIQMGDVFFNGRYPYIDLNSGGSLEGMIEAVEAANLIVNDDTQIIPGHGPMATREDLLVYHSFLKTLKDRLMTVINEGTALEDINVAKMVSGYEELSWNFINAKKIVSIGYESLKNQP